MPYFAHEYAKGVKQNYQNQQNSPFGFIPGGGDIYSMLMSQLQNGADPKIKQMLMGQSAGQLRGGLQQNRENYAGSGGPIGAQMGADIALRSNNQKNLNNSLTQADMGAKESALQNLFAGTGLNQNILNSNRDYAMQKQQMDDASGFSFGDLFKGLFGLGGSALGGWLSRPRPQ